MRYWQPRNSTCITWLLLFSTDSCVRVKNDDRSSPMSWQWKRIAHVWETPTYLYQIWSTCARQRPWWQLQEPETRTVVDICPGYSYQLPLSIIVALHITNTRIQHQDWAPGPSLTKRIKTRYLLGCFNAKASRIRVPSRYVFCWTSNTYDVMFKQLQNEKNTACALRSFSCCKLLDWVVLMSQRH